MIALAGALSAAPAVHARDATAVRDSAIDLLFWNWSSSTPGCAVGVSQNGQVVLEKAWGMAHLEHAVPNRPDTIFEAGSVSKQFTAAAVLLLARDGKLSLDDPVRRHLPELPDYAQPVTIRHMLQHTSGLRDWGSIEDIAGWPRGTRVYTHAHVLDILRRQRALNFAPGTRWSYSNSGYNLAVMIVSRVAGEPFAEFTRKRIFEPLGMSRTSWRDDHARIVPGRAVAYAGSDGRYRQDMPFENVHGNGGLLTTVGDLLRWNENFAAPTVGDVAFVQELQAVGRLASGEAFDYALGLGVGEYKGLREVSHSGTTASYRAFLARYPDQRLSLAMLCNAGDSTPRQTLHAVADLYLADALENDAMPAASPPSDAELDTLTGLYRNVERGDATRFDRVGSALRRDGETLLAALSQRAFTDGAGSTVTFDGQGGARIDEGNGAPVRLERVAAAQPTAAELAALAGAYASDEAGTTLTARLREGALEIAQPPDRVFPLVPLYKDAFESDLGTIIFRRDRAGRVRGLSLVQERVWDLRFRRQR
jgi:CubicO group peptidase (beta-lactamase class C family)